jgi:riboflavin kinase/FMN adenylyltransferase
MEAGERHGFGVTLVDAFRDEGAHVVSSSRIRGLLCDRRGRGGSGAARLSLHRGGRDLARESSSAGQLGYPTANMAVARVHRPKARHLCGEACDAPMARCTMGWRASAVALRWTDDGEPLLETFVFDFCRRPLWRSAAAVSFFGYLRGEEKFDGLDALVTQIRRDEDEARAMLSAVHAFVGTRSPDELFAGLTTA